MAGGFLHSLAAPDVVLFDILHPARHRVRVHLLGLCVRLRQQCRKALVDPPDVLLFAAFGRRELCVQPIGQTAYGRFIPRFQRARGKLLRADKVSILQKRLGVRHGFLPACHSRWIVEVKLIQSRDRALSQVIAKRTAAHLLLNVRLLLLCLRGQCLRGNTLFQLPIGLLGPRLDARALLCGEELAHIGLRGLRVQIERLLKERVCLLHLAVRQRHLAPLEQRDQVGIRRRCGSGCGLRCRSPRPLGLPVHVQYLPDAPQQVLHEADSAHVLALQRGQLLGQVVGIHAAVAGDQQALSVLGHQRQVAAPLVFDPHGIEVLRPAADDHHHPCAVQRREYVGLVLLTQLVLQRDAREEHLIALLRQAVVDLLRPLAVAGALAVLIRLLVADEHVIGLLAGRYGQYALLDLANLRRLLPVQVAAGGVGRMLHGGQIVRVRQYGHHLHPVARRHMPARRRILDVLDAKAADDRAPVRLCVGIVLLQQLLVESQRLVELALAAEVVRTVVAVQLRFILRLGNGRGAAAVFAGSVGCAGGEFQVAAAHFALDNHVVVSSCPWFLQE